jgi:hypothetical protein
VNHHNVWFLIFKKILAQPNLAVNIEPIVKFYVSQFSSVQGTIVNFASASRKAGIIDFSTGAGVGKFGAKVIQGTDGEFTTTYLAQTDFYREQAILAGKEVDFGISSVDAQKLAQIQEQL